MRAESKVKRTAIRLSAVALITCLAGTLAAEAPPRNTVRKRAEILEFNKKVPSLKSEATDTNKVAARNGMADHPGMMANMRDHMGPYTPRELYPSLMYLPELSPEKQWEIEQVALQRMHEGLKMLGQGRAALTEATKKNDLRRMEQTASKMQAGVARYESGLAALTALKGGQGPQEIALSWFRCQMNLDSSSEVESRTMILGMTPFHLMVCSMMMLFAAVSIWLYFLRMRRVATLIQHLDQSTTSLGGIPDAVALPLANPLARQDTVAKSRLDSWSGHLRVVSTHMETPHVKTIRMVDRSNAVIPFQYLPGQFLQITLEIDGAPVKRSYTIASTPTRSSYIEITVKRETHGSVSRYLHDNVAVGDLIHVTAPAGKFTFTGIEHDSIVLIGGGVGITPLMSVVRALTDIGWEKEIFFVYTCQTPVEFIFREELDYLQKRNSNLKLIVTFSRVTDEIKGFHSGRITKALIADSVPHIANRRVHICGTLSMMQSVKEMLTDLGVAASEIKLEAFGATKRSQDADLKNKPSSENDAPVVTFSHSQKAGPLAVDTTVLEAAEAIDVDIDYACRSGMCGTCKVRLNSGVVAMEVEDGLSSGEKEAGMILACQAKSNANVDVEA